MDNNTTAAPPETASTRKSTKKRVRNFSPEDRAAHRIFERGRREAFKERLTELAGQLPGLAEADPRHLSKHVVVDESIARHKLLESRCVEALYNIRSLMQERDELLAEVNLWRHGAGTAPRRPKTVCRVEGLVETEKESQRRPSAGHAWGRCSEQNEGSSGGRSQDRTGPDEVTIEASHIPRILPAEPALEPHALSHLDGLLLNTAWSGPPPPQPPSTTAFPSEAPPMTIPNHHVPLGLNAAISEDPLSATTTSSADDYQIFGDIGLHQQLPLLNMDSFPPPPPDAGLFTESVVPLSPGYMASTGLSHGVSLQQPQQWVSWHG